MRFLQKKTLLKLSLILGFCSYTNYAQQAKISIVKDAKIEALLLQKQNYLKNRKESDNYQIQVYSGSFAMAKKIEQTVSKKHHWPCKIDFETPNYKVKITGFKTRLEADKKLLEIKKKFNNALIIRP